ncbi:hypothetical protein B7P34_20355 [Streptosporangium nondiastaticum]|uniref:RHS repeat protein n=2 Tax=Streptosporangium nondiastaticum TaxID=35764 RepID=A0A9X7JNL1_9ACTN|nr:hypothetical protein B7P34_20355 [Streptosporangium nondiastaticum]
MSLAERKKQVSSSRGSYSPMREFVRPRASEPSAHPGEKPDRPLKNGPAARGSGSSLARAPAPAGVPNPDWVSSFAVAYPGTLAIGGHLQFSSVPASSVSGLWLYVLDEQKRPVHQQEIKRRDADDPVGKYLENGVWCYGWWPSGPSNPYPDNQCFWWTSSSLGGHLEDGKKYYAWIFLEGTDGSASPTGTTSPFVEAFYTPDIPGAQAGSCTCYGQTYRADPVNTATGMFYDRNTDATLVGAGTPFSLDRTYRSDSSAAGLLGRGWSTPFDSKLTAAADGSATLQESDGARIVFKERSGGSYTAPAGSALKLAKSGGTYTVTSPDLTRRTYNGAGLLTSVTDRSGQGLSLDYASGRLASVKDAAGRTIPFTLDAAGLLTKVALPDGTSVSYSYTGGLLTSVTDQAGKTSSYTHDANKRLVTATGRGGGKVTNTYDNDGRVVSQTDSFGKTTTFTRSDNRDVHTTDRSGGVWTDVYSGNVLMASIDPYGKKVEYSYDRNLRPVSITDALGNTTEMTYDSAGRMTMRKSPSSVGLAETWTYDSAGNIASHSDSRGKTWRYGYDSANRITTSTDPSGGKVTYDYTERGALAGVTTPQGKKTTYAYDGAGNRTSVTSPLGEKTTFRYDAMGRVTAVTDPRGNATGAGPKAFTTTYSYDSRGLLSSTTDPLGGTTAYGYDDAGRLTSVTDPAERTTSRAVSRRPPTRQASPRRARTTPPATSSRSPMRWATRPPTPMTRRTG